MGKQLLIIFMIFVTCLAIYIVYQPEEQVNLNIPEKNQSNYQDDSIKTVKKVTSFLVFQPNTQSIFICIKSLDAFNA
jgi:ABC-type transport system involved in multi-copper enzyme maturation permease subunit